MEATFECVTCASTKPLAEKLTFPDGLLFCSECFERGCKSQFETALATITAWPVKYGTTILHPRDFPRMFDADFIERYEAREAEYDAVRNKRVRCQHLMDRRQSEDATYRPTDMLTADHRNYQPCGSFVGYEKPGRIQECSRCTGPTCMKCEVSFRPEIEEHTCPKRSVVQYNDLGRRGQDWQTCPRCDSKVQLRDGCNHLICAICFCSFCFICGEECAENSGHWLTDRPNPCPRWNQPLSEDAQFDRIATNEELVAEQLQTMQQLRIQDVDARGFIARTNNDIRNTTSQRDDVQRALNGLVQLGLGGGDVAASYRQQVNIFEGRLDDLRAARSEALADLRDSADQQRQIALWVESLPDLVEILGRRRDLWALMDEVAAGAVTTT